MNPLFIVGVGAAALFLYEANNTSVKLKTARNSSEHIPLGSSVMTNIKENPFHWKEKIEAIKIQPTQKGMMENPRMAGKWMLTLPGGQLMTLNCSLDKLQRKVAIIVPNPTKENVKGLRKLHANKYAISEPLETDIFQQ